MTVEDVHITLMGDEAIMFTYDDKDTGTEEDVVLMLGDVQQVLAALSGGTAH